MDEMVEQRSGGREEMGNTRECRPPSPPIARPSDGRGELMNGGRDGKRWRRFGVVMLQAITYGGPLARWRHEHTGQRFTRRRGGRGGTRRDAMDSAGA